MPLNGPPDLDSFYSARRLVRPAFRVMLAGFVLLAVSMPVEFLSEAESIIGRAANIAGFARFFMMFFAALLAVVFSSRAKRREHR